MSVNFPIRGTLIGVKPPICAICTGGDEPRIVLVQKGKGIRHWPHEEHVTKVCDETPNNVTPVTKHPSLTGIADDECPQYKTGRPKKYKNRAAQQAAYRRRHEHQP